MDRLLKLTVLGCALLAPTVTTAQLVLGVRAGAAVPLGELEAGKRADEIVARVFPVEASVGWLLAPDLEVGLQGGYGFGSISDAWTNDCSATGRDCSVHLWRLAARGEYAAAKGDFLPFVAATLGWEWEVERWETSADNWDRFTRSGWLAGIEAGADLPLAKGLQMGAFVGASFGQLLSRSLKREVAGLGTEDAGAITSPEMHGWISIGVRGKFTL